jgi:predicted ABC-type ATPase
MTPSTPKRLRMFAGPNGSGKTSLVRKFARDFSADGLFQLHHFLNADDIFRDLQEGKGVALGPLGRAFTTEEVRTALVRGGRLGPDHPFPGAAQVVNARLTAPAGVCDAYAAAAVADFLRDELLAAGQSFSFETVMSHRSKVDVFARARAGGYRTYLCFIATEAAHINLYRVQARAALGGHDVPESKVVERYKRCLELVGEALSHAYRGFLFDNSGAEPVWLAQLTPERTLHLEVAASALPAWFRTWVTPHYPGAVP